ncbi:MAG TPA: glycosyltransferase family 39 protein [Chloroflexota bacterium]|nr:glycosyltransferase family 39 protein [Chloroflexota bacterium]
MPGTNRAALYQLVSTALAPLLLLFGIVILYLAWSLVEAGPALPALLALAGAGAALVAALKLQAVAVGVAPDAPAGASAAPTPSAVAAEAPPRAESAGAPALPFRLALPEASAAPAPPLRSHGSAAASLPAAPVAESLARARWLRALLVAFAITAALTFRLVALDDLPGEFFGDIATIYESVDTVLKGHWPTTFEQSNGPLYGYVIAPVIAVVGQQGFLPYKLASVVVGLLGILLTFFVVRELVGTDLALIASVVLSASSWDVTFSRLGNSQILSPTLVAASLLLLVLGIKRQDFRLIVAGLAVSTLSYYGYAPLLVLPGAYVLAAAFYVNRRQLAALVAFAALLTVPFLLVIWRQQDIFIAGSGYIGSKLLTQQNLVEKIAANVWRSLLMFHVRGDAIFRVNSPGMPQLDLLSGLFLLVGVVYWLRAPQRRWLPLLLVPFIILQAPANLVLNEVMPTPSASRSIGILPIVAAVIAGGIWEVARRIRDERVRRPAFVVVVLCLIGWLNWQRYFVAYASALPEQNSPYGKIIAAYLDTLPADATVVLYSCCWAGAGQPEPKGILYVVQHPRPFRIVERGRFTCAALNLPGPVDVIWDPRDDGPVPPPSCYPGAQVRVHYDARGQPVFKDFYIARDAAASAAPH